MYFSFIFLTLLIVLAEGMSLLIFTALHSSTELYDGSMSAGFYYDLGVVCPPKMHMLKVSCSVTSIILREWDL